MDNKRILITSTDVMMYQFLLPHALYLSNNGFIVDLACSYADGYGDFDYHQVIKKQLPQGSKFYSIDLHRSPLRVKNYNGYKQLKELINNNNYDFIWTNEPVMGVMTRLAARKTRREGTKVLYLVHGFQFYRLAPKINWLAYPIEKIMSKFCDSICVINWEDYEIAKSSMYAKSVYHINGIGFNYKKFRDCKVDVHLKRNELGFSDDDFIIASVGEVRALKNHESILRAIAALHDHHLKYVICGKGNLEDYLKKVAQELGIADCLYLLGHRSDIPEILKISDIFAHPSTREGLGIAAIEAMAAGLPLVSSNIHGIKDYSIDGVTGFVNSPKDIAGYSKSLEKLINNSELREKFSVHNVSLAEKYDLSYVQCEILSIIRKSLE